MHGRKALDFASSSDCEKMVTDLTHIAREVLDLVVTDVMILLRFGLARRLRPQIIGLFSLMLCRSNQILTFFVESRSTYRTLWTGSWLEET